MQVLHLTLGIGFWSMAVSPKEKFRRAPAVPGDSERVSGPCRLSLAPGDIGLSQVAM